MPAPVTVRRAARRTLSNALAPRTAIDPLEPRRMFNATPHRLLLGPLTQDWNDRSLITSDNMWNNVPSIEGFSGNGFVVSPGVNPQTLIGSDTPGVKDVDANVTQLPSNYNISGIAEMAMNPVIGGTGTNTVAFQGAGTSTGAHAPYLKFYLDATGMGDITLNYDLIDIDSNDLAEAQQVAVHYRVGTTGSFTNLPAGYVANASGPGAGKTTSMQVALPASLSGEPYIEVRIMTADAAGTDELIAIENINISGTPMENPPGAFAFTAPSYSVVESVGTATFIVQRINGSNGAVSVGYSTLGGTALAGSDFIATSGTLNFADGEVSKNISVTILNDTAFEPDETFSISLSNPTNGALLGTPSVASVTILGNDTAGEIAFAPASYSRDENFGAVELIVRRANGTDGAVSVNWTTVDGSATSPGDFVAAGGVIDFQDGELEQRIYITLTDDFVQESNEQFSVVLSDPTNGAVLGAASTATVTITNEDLVGALAFAPAQYSVNENGGTITLSVTRSGSSAVPTEVNWTTVSGTATSPGDFVAASGVLSFIGDETQQILIQINNDLLQEANEQFTVVLSNATNAVPITVSTATVTVLNDDLAGQFSFDPTNYTIREDNGSVTLTVTRTLGTSGPASVAWTSVNGTATSPDDYLASSGVLNFANGETSKTIVVSIVDNSTLEQEESFTLVLSGPTNNATLGNATASVTIFDNDSNTPTGLILNELDVNPPGTDLPYQYVELRGAPGAVLHDIYLIEIEGDLAQNPGKVNAILSIEGATLGSNGLLLIRSNLGFEPESPQTGLFDTPLFSPGTVGAIDFQPGSTSFILAFSFGTMSLTVGTDLDTGNSGTLALPSNLAVLDSVGALDGNTGDRAYGAVIGSVSNDPLSPDAPDAYTRFASNAVPNDPSAWYWGNLVGGVNTSKTYSSIPSQRSPNFPDDGILTPGAMLGTSGVVIEVDSAAFEFEGSSQSILVTFNTDVGASLAASDFELTNLTTGASVSLVLQPVGTGGTTARLTFAETGGIGPALLTNGDYRFRVKAGEVGNGTSVLAGDRLSTFFFLNADFNHDRAVNFDDLLKLAQNYGRTGGASFVDGDVTYDGNIDFDDLLALAQRYGSTLVTTSAAASARRRTSFGEGVIA